MKGKVREGKGSGKERHKRRVGRKEGFKSQGNIELGAFVLRAKKKKRYRAQEEKLPKSDEEKRTSIRVHCSATDCAGKYRGKRQILYVPLIVKEEE